MRNISHVLILGIFMVLTGCASYYGIIKESKPSGDLNSYDIIHVDGLILGKTDGKNMDMKIKIKTPGSR